MKIPEQDTDLIIERARQEKLTEEEVKVYDEFIAEAGVNLNKIALNDADAIVRLFHESGATNEFIANTINRLAQILPTDITARILLSDNDGDGVPLYRELELGTKATFQESSREITEAKISTNQKKSRNSDIEL